MTEATPERILLVGDLHGATEAAFQAIEHASALNADLILQLGDLGFWPGEAPTYRYLLKAAKRLRLRGLQMVFVPGNHEQWSQLKRLPIQSDRTVWLRDDEGQFSPTIKAWPLGYRTVWGGTTWLSIPGASSVDRVYRSPGVDWWPDEIQLTEERVPDVVAGGPAQVVVAHDAPWVEGSWLHAHHKQHLPPWRRAQYTPWPVSALIKSDEHQKRLREVVDGVGATKVFHGHHHERYSATYQGTQGEVQVEGLGMNGDPLAQLTLLVDETGTPILEP